MSNKIQNSILFTTFILNILFNVDVSANTIDFVPRLTQVYSDDQLVQFNCSVTTDDLSADNQTILFGLKYKDNYIVETEPEFTDGFYAFKQFYWTYGELRSIASIVEDSFQINFIAWYKSELIGNESAKVVFVKKGFNESCSEEAPCNSNANLVCGNYSLCVCDDQFVAVPDNTSSAYNCYPKVGFNETCIDDRQCRAVDPHTDCGQYDAVSKRCQCSAYYAFDGEKCYANWYYWLCWSVNPYDIIIILMVFSIGLSFLLIVIAYSLHLRSKHRRAITDSNNTIGYPSGLPSKSLVSKYFGQKEDQKQLKSFDYLSHQD